MPRYFGTIFLFIAAACHLSACRGVRPSPPRAAEPVSASALDLNSASTEELQRLPGIGAGTAEKIVAFRRLNGTFMRTEQLLLVDGISERKYRLIRPLVRVGSPGN